MTENNDHKLSDEELEALVAGKGPIADAYKSLDYVQPSPELDARILGKARESVSLVSEQRRDVFIRPYATAATVFLCLGITFLWLNEPGVPTPADFTQQRETTSQPVTINLDLDNAPDESGGENILTIDDFQDGAVEALQEEAGELERRRTQQSAQADAQRRSEQAVAAELAEIVESAVRQAPETPPAGEVAAANAPAVLPAGNSRAEPDAAEPRTSSAASTERFASEIEEIVVRDNNDALEAIVVRRSDEELEEITVTGSRITDNPGYRLDRDDWIAEIVRLVVEGEVDAAFEEATLYLDSYPDTDMEALEEAVEAALADLEAD